MCKKIDELMEENAKLKEALVEATDMFRKINALATPPAAGEPVYQSRIKNNGEWRECSKQAYEQAVGYESIELRILWTTPPDAEHGDDPVQWTDQQVRNFLATALRHVDVKGTLHCQDIRDAFKVMRAQAGQGKS